VFTTNIYKQTVIRAPEKLRLRIFLSNVSQTRHTLDFGIGHSLISLKAYIKHVLHQSLPKLLDLDFDLDLDSTRIQVDALGHTPTSF